MLMTRSWQRLVAAGSPARASQRFFAVNCLQWQLAAHMFTDTSAYGTGMQFVTQEYRISQRLRQNYKSLYTFSHRSIIVLLDRFVTPDFHQPDGVADSDRSSAYMAIKTELSGQY